MSDHFKTAFKHQRGRHDQKRHGWRFGGESSAGNAGKMEAGPAAVEFARRAVLHNPTWDNMLVYEREQRRMSTEGPNPLRAKIEAATAGREPFASLPDKQRAAGVQQLVDVLTLGTDAAALERMEFYNQRLNLGLTADDVLAFRHSDKAVEKEIFRNRIKLEQEMTYQPKGHKKAWVLGGEEDAAPLQPHERLASDPYTAGDIITAKFGAKVKIMDTRLSNDMIIDELSQLNRLAERNPSIQRALRNTDEIVFRHDPNRTAVASVIGKTLFIQHPDINSGYGDPVLHPPTAGVWAHELGHVMANSWGFKDRTQFRDLFASRKKRISNYAWTNDDESQAELYAAWIMNPAPYKDYYAEQFAWFEENWA